MALLRNQVAVITGAANGIGRAVSKLFAEHGAALVLSDSGANVSGTLHDPTALGDWASDLRKQGAQVVEHSENLSTAQGTASLFDVVRREYQGLNVLVNCAGILRDRALLNLQDDDVSAVLDLHVLGTFRLVRGAAAMMRDGGGGRIINTTSQQALFGASGQCANSIAAAATIGITRAAAAELLRHRIYVNAVAPLAKTRQTEHLPLFLKAKGMTPEHVAPAYLFLASELAGDLSGETLTISGGRLGAIVFTEAEGVFADGDGAHFDVDSLAHAWPKVQR